MSFEERIFGEDVAKLYQATKLRSHENKIIRGAAQAAMSSLAQHFDKYDVSYIIRCFDEIDRMAREEERGKLAIFNKLLE